MKRLLVVHVFGHSPQLHVVEGAVSVGRDPGNEIRIDIPYVPPQLGTFSLGASGLLLTPLTDAADVTHRGRPLTGSVELAPGDFIRIGGVHPGEMVTLLSAIEQGATGDDHFPVIPGLVVRIGSGPDSDLVAGGAGVAGSHAEIVCDEDGVELVDLGTGKTRVNGKLVRDTVTLADGNVVSIGSLTVTLSGERLACTRKRVAVAPGTLPAAQPVEHLPGFGGALLEARHLKRVVRQDINLLQDVSLRLKPRELVVVVGLSGAGKSTLLDALAGYQPASSGQVLVDETDLYRHFDRFRPRIGFVPQKDIIHLDLTVEEALDYAARLRLPPGTSTADRHRRVHEVMNDLDLTGRAGVAVRSLSGGQQKRVSIGVELITSPPLFFLDEPSSGLDPGTETQLTLLLRRLADQGRTVVVITHATKNLALADKVAFLARGGNLVWYGPPTDAVKYFDGFRTDAERERNAEMTFDSIYTMIEDEARGTPGEWAERYRSDRAYGKQISVPLRLDVAEMPTPKAPPDRLPQVSALRQLLILSARNLRLITRDRFSLILMLLAPWLLASMDFLITTRDMFDARHGSVIRVSITLATMGVNAILVGALSLSREIVKDNQIYRRERLVNLGLVPYVLSKVWVAALVAAYQAVAWVLVLYLAVSMPGGAEVAAGIYVTMFLTVLSGTMLGLLSSAAAPTEGATPLILALLVIPQVLFNGSLIPIPLLTPAAQAVTVPMSARWTFETLMTQTRVGSDLVADPGWHLTRGLRDALTPGELASHSCLGANIFTRCAFPGIGTYYQAGVDAAPPLLLAQPHGLTDSRAQVAYLTSALKYQSDYVAWKTAHDRPIASAEAVLSSEYDNYGYLFAVDVTRHWLYLLAIIVGILFGVLGIQRLKEGAARRFYA
ncbi:MAG: FHA domain-containing protein [Candidatus Dormibacteria bacterium]